MRDRLNDACQVYRCWIVYSKSKTIVILPSLLWLGSAVCGVIIIARQISIHATVSLTTVSKMQPFMIAFLTSTLVQNIVTTCVWFTCSVIPLILFGSIDSPSHMDDRSCCLRKTWISISLITATGDASRLRIWHAFFCHSYCKLWVFLSAIQCRVHYD